MSSGLLPSRATVRPWGHRRPVKVARLRQCHMISQFISFAFAWAEGTRFTGSIWSDAVDPTVKRKNSHYAPGSTHSA